MTPTLLLFPYTAFHSGVVPAIVGISMVPISLVLIVPRSGQTMVAVRERRRC